MRKSLPWFVGFSIMGIYAAGVGIQNWHCQEPVKFILYLLVGSVAAPTKVGIPGISGTLAGGLLVVMSALVELSHGEALAVGLATVLAQVYWRPKARPAPARTWINVANIAVTVMIARELHRLALGVPGGWGVPLAVAGVSFGYFVVNTLSIAVAISVTGGGSVARIWRRCYFWSYPHYLAAASLAGMLHVTEERVGWGIAVLYLPIVYLYYRSYSTYTGRLEDSQRHAEETASLHLRSIEGLALAIEAKDDTTHLHLQRVQAYALGIGEAMGLDSTQLQALQAAAILHDVGKLAVPEYIICKPGKLTPDEFEKMKVHTIVGAEIVDRVQFPYPVAPLVRSHHEKWDGSGYPDGLKGEDIPLGGRILACVDCFDALASDRQYRRALPLDKALSIVVSESGKAFDPRVVELLQRDHVKLEKLAQANAAKATKLSTNIKISRGQAPDAGYESQGQSLVPTGVGGRLDFLEAIVSVRNEVQTLLGIETDAVLGLSLEEKLFAVGSRLRPLVGHDAFALFEVADGHLAAKFATGDDSDLLRVLRVKEGLGLVGWVAQTHKPILNGDPSVEPEMGLKRATKLRSAAAVPMVLDDRVAGVLAVYSTRPEAFNRDQLRILQAVGGKVARRMYSAASFAKARPGRSVAAREDLLSVREFVDAAESMLQECRVSGKGAAIAIHRINGLRWIRENLDREAAVTAFHSVVEAMRREFRVGDLLGHLREDELVVLSPMAEAGALKDRLKLIGGALERDCRGMFGCGVVTISSGFAHYGEDGESVEELLIAADERISPEPAYEPADIGALAEAIRRSGVPSQPCPVPAE